MANVLFSSGMLGALFIALLLSLRFSHQPNLDLPSCQNAIVNGSAIAEGLINFNGTVNRNGQTVNKLEDIEGVRFPECEIMCGTGWQRETWSDIFNSLSGWLLPWLALTAQLPFQTRDKIRDLVSVFLIIGTPILAMYSLLVTFYNGDWVQKQCRREEVISKSKEKLIHMDCVAEVLLGCQHIPLYVTNEEKLTRSTELKEDPLEDWWENLAENLRDTGRHVTPSLWAQLLLATISYVFTLIVAFGKIGDNPTGYGLGLGIAWSWIVPLICGWLAVGTPNSRRSIMKVLERADRAFKDFPKPSAEIVPTTASVVPTTTNEESTTQQRDSDHQRHADTPDQNGATEMVPIQQVSTSQLPLLPPPVDTTARSPKKQPPIFSQRKIEIIRPRENTSEGIFPRERFMFFWTYYGDQLEPGPIFNYARSHIFRTFAENVIQSHRAKSTPLTFDYRPWPVILKHFSLAFLFHFIPLTAAFFIAVETPTKGLGCRSGPLIIILSASFLSAIFLIISAELSTRWSQTSPRNRRWLGYTAMMFLLLGKVTAYLNAAWFLIHCHFQFIGFYKRCWCWSCRIWLHDFAYINFLTDVEKWDEAVRVWASCFAIATAAMIVYLGYFVVEGYRLHHPRKDKV